MDQQNKHALIEKMDRIDTILDEYESSIGLATYQNEFANTNTAYAYMNMSRDQIEKMDIEGCAEAAYILGSLSFHLQRSINRETARLPITNLEPFVYSFALKPEQHQPSGTCNFSRLDNAVLKLTLSPDTSGSSEGLDVFVYALNYNILRIQSGMGGLAYSN